MPEKTTLVDSCVLLDVATNDPKWADRSGEALASVLDEGRVVVNPLVYAEVSVGFSSIEEFEEALPPEEFHREGIPFDAAFLAGKAFLAYRRRGGGKASPLPDFFIGAHAAVRRYRLLTRDEARYRTYFPTVELLTP